MAGRHERHPAVEKRGTNFSPKGYVPTDAPERRSSMYISGLIFLVYGVSRRRQGISSLMEFSVSLEIDPGIADTVATITCPLSSAPDGVCPTSLSLRLDDGANTCGLEVVNGVIAARSPRSSGSCGTVQLGWWYFRDFRFTN